jgi:hypothetical protein
MGEIITPIIVAVITGGFALAGTVISNAVNHGKTIYRIEQLEKKQDKHNSLIERMYSCENAIDLLNERQKVLSGEVDYIKGKI